MDELADAAFSELVEAKEKPSMALAISSPVKGDYDRLRRHEMLPKTQRHKDYVLALNRYVYHKLRARRLSKHLFAHNEMSLYHHRKSNEWRNLMDAIEFGLEYALPVSDIVIR